MSKPQKKVIKKVYCKQCLGLILPVSATRPGGVCLRCSLENEDNLQDKEKVS